MYPLASKRNYSTLALSLHIFIRLHDSSESHFSASAAADFVIPKLCVAYIAAYIGSISIITIHVRSGGRGSMRAANGKPDGTQPRTSEQVDITVIMYMTCV